MCPKKLSSSLCRENASPLELEANPRHFTSFTFCPQTDLRDSNIWTLCTIHMVRLETVLLVPHMSYGKKD